MSWSLRISLFLLFCALVGQACAQRAVQKSRYSFSVPKVRGNKARIICPVFDRGRYPYHGLGFKLGDPFALTYKYYASKNFAVAVDFGRTASGLYRAYYRGQFEQYLIEAGETANTVYIGHKINSDWVLDTRILYHADVSRAIAGLQFYAGGGWAWKRTVLVYDYHYTSIDPDSDPFGSLAAERLAMGPQLVAGIEYSYFRIPVSAFMEAEYFMDVRENPGVYRIEGGIGLRYVF